MDMNKMNQNFFFVSFFLFFFLACLCVCMCVSIAHGHGHGHGHGYGYSHDLSDRLKFKSLIDRHIHMHSLYSISLSITTTKYGVSLLRYVRHFTVVKGGRRPPEDGVALWPGVR